jgi:hypothetical protein
MLDFKLKGIYSFNLFMMKNWKISNTLIGKTKEGAHLRKNILNKILSFQLFKMLKFNEQSNK